MNLINTDHHGQVVNETCPPSWKNVEIIEKNASEWKLDDISCISFEHVDEAEHFYNRYAFVTGFSIRKDKLNLNGDVITMRKFVCSKAGFRRQCTNDSGSPSTKYHRYVTRCGCPASFKVRLSREDGLYYPAEFITNHNHDLVPTTYSHILRSHKDIDDASAHQIAELLAAGIKPSQIMDVLVKSRGGFENVGFTNTDLYNHVYRSYTDLGNNINDCNIAMQYINSVAVKDPGVYCRYETDDQGRFNRLFFAETIARTEYRAFGDVVLCDSTYKTNHFKLPLVLLLGVDNHYSTIVFACALLSNETHKAYKWVFENFINCMEGKHLRSIITDGDRAMRSAIQQCMPDTRHKLCGFHILRNLTGVCADTNFKFELNKLITKRYSVVTFKRKWTELLHKYGLNKGERRWVTEMQQTFHLWAETFFDDCFFAGMVTNNRAESTNSTLKKCMTDTLPLSQFVYRYMYFLDRMRQKAMKNECKNSQSMPYVEDNGFPSVRSQIANLYTLQMYKKVDEQIRNQHLFRPILLNLSTNSEVLSFDVEKYDSASKQSKFTSVIWEQSENILTCTCGLMDSIGLPCSHMFSVMRQHNICTLPSSTLLPRWMKNARSMCNLSSSCSDHVTGTAYRLALIRPYCDRLAFVSSVGDEQLEVAEREIESLCDRLIKMSSNGEKLSTPSQPYTSTHSGKRPIMHNPPIVRTKGAPRVDKANKRPRLCGNCKGPGHNKTTCTYNVNNDSQP